MWVTSFELSELVTENLSSSDYSMPHAFQGKMQVLVEKIWFTMECQ